MENVHAPFQIQNDLWLDNLDGEAAMDCYLECVQDCAAFGIPAVVVHLPDDDHPTTPLGLQRVRRLAEKAEDCGVNVALENLGNRWNLEYVLAQVDSPRVGFCYDSAHHYRLHAGVDYLALYGGRLMALHLHDNGSDGRCHALPFDGTINWPLAMGQIAGTGYTGPTAIEGMNWKYTQHSIEWYLREAAARGKRLEALRKQEE